MSQLACCSYTAILIMTEFSLLREVSRTPERFSRGEATPRPHQGHTEATPRPHQSHTKATPKPTTQAISKAGGRGNRLFSQGFGHNENCWLIYSSRPTQMPAATSGASTGRSNSRKPPTAQVSEIKQASAKTPC